MTTVYSYQNVEEFVGREIGISGWMEVPQSMIHAFAACTGDRFWYHTDPERARRESPFGAAIAHGYLSLSLLAALGNEIGMVPDDARGVANYGLNRVRFLAPVPAGARVRLALSVLEVAFKPQGKLITLNNTLELEGSKTPALVAQTLIFLMEKRP
ncbi:MAG: MaoC-like dehydratase [Ramlibacter sp.]|nr:MaoC-like dehydratase [Ramlibacter sp.]